MNARSLVVLAPTARAGTIRADLGAWTFDYDEAFRTNAGAFPLSPHFPLSESSFADASDDRRVEWYFENLLPEGGVRRALAQMAHVDERDAFALLRRFGEESAGALTIVPETGVTRPPGRYVRLPKEELRNYLRGLPSVPLIAAGGRAKMSLAGAQHKLGVRIVDADFFLPDGLPSTHIVKPDNARPEAYPFCPANEHFVMTLARAAGLRAPATTLLHLPEPLYVIERFDRLVAGDDVRRTHQIDLCQMLNKWPGYKYEADGGATVADVFRAADLLRQPAVAKASLIRWLVFNYLVGNSDAHAKNVAFLVSRDHFDLAPFYDLLSVKVYGDDSLAMSIGGEDRYGLVTSQSWSVLAEQIGVRPLAIERVRRELARTMPSLAVDVAQLPEFTAEERAFLAKVVALIREHAEFLREGL